MLTGMTVMYVQPAPRSQSGSFGTQTRAPKLEIKKDAKGMVTVPGATMIEVTSARELLSTIEKGQQRRHVSSTQVLTPCVLPSYAKISHHLINCSGCLTSTKTLSSVASRVHPHCHVYSNLVFLSALGLFQLL